MRASCRLVLRINEAVTLHNNMSKIYSFTRFTYTIRPQNAHTAFCHSLVIIVFEKPLFTSARSDHAHVCAAFSRYTFVASVRTLKQCRHPTHMTAELFYLLLYYCSLLTLRLSCGKRARNIFSTHFHLRAGRHLIFGFWIARRQI